MASDWLISLLGRGATWIGWFLGITFFLFSNFSLFESESSKKENFSKQFFFEFVKRTFTDPIRDKQNWNKWCKLCVILKFFQRIYFIQVFYQEKSSFQLDESPTRSHAQLRPRIKVFTEIWKVANLPYSLHLLHTQETIQLGACFDRSATQFWIAWKSPFERGHIDRPFLV